MAWIFYTSTQTETLAKKNRFKAGHLFYFPGKNGMLCWAPECSTGQAGTVAAVAVEYLAHSAGALEYIDCISAEE